jgi:hypothetical protein
MKNILIAAVLAITCFVGISVAQSEVFVGAQYVRVNPDVRQLAFRFDTATDSVGVAASITSYQTKSLGLVADGGAVFNAGDASSQLYTALGGVQYKYRGYTKFQPFVKGAAGLGIIRVDAYNRKEKTDADIAFKGSVGLDYGIGKYKWRIFEAGYLQTRFYSQRQDNFVFSTGLVF